MTTETLYKKTLLMLLKERAEPISSRSYTLTPEPSLTSSARDALVFASSVCPPQYLACANVDYRVLDHWIYTPQVPPMVTSSIVTSNNVKSSVFVIRLTKLHFKYLT